MSQLAVIKTGGKQYVVTPGQKLEVEKLLQKEGDEVLFNDVLLVEKDGKIDIGTPTVLEANVKAKVLSQGKGDKIIIFHYKTKKKEKKKGGHRQLLTKVEITEISNS